MLIKLRSYFFWRTISSIGDEVWAIALPIFISNFLDSSAVGLAYSFGSVGTIFGFLIASWLSHKVSDAKGAMLSDVLQSVVYMCIAILVFYKISIQKELWFLIFFIVGLFSAVWFALSETMVSRLSLTSENSIHKWNYFSGTFGPILGPAIAGSLIAIGMFVLAPFINAISFLGQAWQLNKISDDQKKEQLAIDSIDTSWFTKFNIGIKQIFKDKRLASMTSIPLSVKVCLVGVFPFLLIKLSKIGISPILCSVIMIFFPLGSLFGAFVYQNKKFGLINFSLLNNVYTMLLSMILLGWIYIAKSPFLILIPIVLFISGFTSAQYTIQLRTIRQTIVPKDILSVVISAQSLLVRLVTPISGLMFGFLVIENLEIGIIIYSILLVIAFIGVRTLNAENLKFNANN